MKTSCLVSLSKEHKRAGLQEEGKIDPKAFSNRKHIAPIQIVLTDISGVCSPLQVCFSEIVDTV